MSNVPPPPMPPTPAGGWWGDQPHQVHPTAPPNYPPQPQPQPQPQPSGYPPGYAPPGYPPASSPPSAAFTPQPAFGVVGPALPAGVTLSSPGKRLGGMLLTVLLLIVTLGIGYLIWAIIAWTKSTTPAKQVLGMKVIHANTLQPATTGQMWARQFLWPIVIGIGNLVTFGILSLVDAFMVFSDKRQRILDRMATTYVVDDPHDAWRIKR